MGFTLCPLTHCLITLRCDPRPFHPIFHPPNLVARAKEGEWLSPGRRHPDTTFIVEETRRLRPVVCGTLHRSATHLIFPASVRPFAHPSNSFVLKNLPVSCSFQRPNLQNSSYSLENREFTGGRKRGWYCTTIGANRRRIGKLLQPPPLPPPPEKAHTRRNLRYLTPTGRNGYE